MEENDGLIDQVELVDIKENDNRLIFLGIGNMSKFCFFHWVLFFFPFPSKAWSNIWSGHGVRSA